MAKLSHFYYDGYEIITTSLGQAAGHTVEVIGADDPRPQPPILYEATEFETNQAACEDGRNAVDYFIDTGRWPA